jgi:O-antigen/teichoic acid export membrane protein
MIRQILGYLPATVVPAATSFVMIYAYTRLLTPADYGDFSLAFSAILLIQTSFLFAIPMAVIRFYPEAVAENHSDAFLRVCYAGFLVLSAVVVVAMLTIGGLAHMPTTIPWNLAILVVLVRSAVVLNQSVNRMCGQMRRYNAIECAHAVLGFGFGVIFVRCGLGSAATAVLLGLLAGAALCLLTDLKRLLMPFRQSWRALDRAAMAQLARFAMPLMAMDSIVCVLALSDRFLLQAFGGAGALGIYTVAFNLVERPTSLICATVATATYPLSVEALQTEGRAAGARQAGRNAAILMSIIIPACVGLALTAPYLTAVMVGAEFRAGVAALIPLMCATALLRGISTHVSDHAFHLAAKPTLALWVYGPVAAANVILNLILIPRYGMFAAAWVGLVCQAVAVLVGFCLGRRAFPVPWPFRENMKIIVAVMPMCVGLSLVSFPLSWSGLCLAVALGIALFSLFALLLDIGAARSVMSRLLSSTRAVEATDPDGFLTSMSEALTERIQDARQSATGSPSGLSVRKFVS